jgi:hypothetical protein
VSLNDFFYTRVGLLYTRVELFYTRIQLFYTVVELLYDIFQVFFDKNSLIYGIFFLPTKGVGILMGLGGILIAVFWVRNIEYMDTNCTNFKTHHRLLRLTHIRKIIKKNKLTRISRSENN